MEYNLRLLESVQQVERGPRENTWALTDRLRNIAESTGKVTICALGNSVEIIARPGMAPELR